MIRINLDINISEDIELAPERIRQSISNSMYDIGQRLVNKSREYIDSDDKNGRVYRIKLVDIIIDHQSSAPLESPANLTGVLKDSIEYRYAGGRDLIFRAGNSRVKYARALELGNLANNLEKRPYLIKAIDELKNTNYSIISNNINRIVL